jgi:hypothetical protein
MQYRRNPIQQRGIAVSYLMTHFWPGGTEAEYRINLQAVHPATGLPDGQTFHAAGPTDGGFLIAAVWKSKEHADRFVQEILLPTMPLEGGLAGPPEERTAEIVNQQSA